jgi:hypothetical protein
MAISSDMFRLWPDANGLGPGGPTRLALSNSGVNAPFTLGVHEPSESTSTNECLPEFRLGRADPDGTPSTKECPLGGLGERVK